MLFKIVFLMATTILLNFISCTLDRNKSNLIRGIESIDDFNTIIETAGTKLIAFDLYTDWCMPCRILSPVLSEIAKEHQNQISIYKVDSDKYPQIINAFDVSGIPFVVFIKNGKAVHAIMGLQSKQAYVDIIEEYADMPNQIDNDSIESQDSINQLRVIQNTTDGNCVL